MGAFETKTIAALAIHYVLVVVVRDALSGVVAFFRVGTPLDVLIVIGERLAVPSEVPAQYFTILLVVLVIEQLVEHRVWHYDVAAKLLAMSVQTLFRIRLNIHLKPVLPAALAKLVTTNKLQGH